MPPENLFQLLQPQMATTQAVSTGVAHDEINSLIYKKKEIEPSLLDFIRKSVSTVEGLEPEDTSYGRAIAQIVEEHGSPYINQSLGDWGRAKFKLDLRDAQSQNYPVDTILTRPGSRADLLSELSHAKQYNVSEVDRRKMSKRRYVEQMLTKKEELDELYGVPGTTEYEAHTEIEPLVRKRFFTLLDSLSAPITVESLFQNQ